VSDVPQKKPDGPVVAQAEPPVVARLVIEIRSDGSRTVARGMAEDALRGERVSIEAAGATPLALALSLVKQLIELPALARSFTRGFLAPKKK
jgi:hypothetical protein